ncbi:MAG: hypothetical protein ACHQK9_13760 [Reyranellales bacterium]
MIEKLLIAIGEMIASLAEIAPRLNGRRRNVGRPNVDDAGSQSVRLT